MAAKLSPHSWGAGVARTGKQAVAQQMVQKGMQEGAEALPALPGSNGVHPTESLGFSQLCTHHDPHSGPDRALVGLCCQPAVSCRLCPTLRPVLVAAA